MDSKQIKDLMEAYGKVHASKEKDCVDKDKKTKHNCAKKVCHESFGEGTCIPEHHTLLEDGTVTHYDVMFEHGVERMVPVEELEVLISEVHEHVEMELSDDEQLEEGLRTRVGEKIKKHVNKYAYTQGIHNNPGWLRKPEKRAALNKAVRDDIKKNPKAAVKYAAREVKRKLLGDEFDVFDTILEFLIDEGIAKDINEAAWLMANEITEEHIDEIMGLMGKAKNAVKKVKKSLTRKDPEPVEYMGRSMISTPKKLPYTVDTRRPEISVTTYGKDGKSKTFKTRGPV